MNSAIELNPKASIKDASYAEYINEITQRICHGKCFEVRAELPIGIVIMNFSRNKTRMLEWLQTMYGIDQDSIQWIEN